MALISCPECGREISDKAAACPHCGNPMTPVAPPAATVAAAPAVSAVNDEEKQRYLALARRAKDENNEENAARYYDLVLQKDPLNWEASFYQVYFTTAGCRIMNISGAAYDLANCLKNVIGLIADHEAEENRGKAAAEVTLRATAMANMLCTAAVNHYSNHSTVDGAFSECAGRVVACETILEKLVDALQVSFPDNTQLISTAAKAHITFIHSHARFLKREWANETMAKRAELVKRTEPSYTAPCISAPAASSGGCYVATCVYGSYDCPQVWTLRRFRDDTLASTWYGRAFIRTYYAVSPTLVRLFGGTQWFRTLWRGRLDRMVQQLQARGVESSPYQDRSW